MLCECRVSVVVCVFRECCVSVAVCCALCACFESVLRVLC